MNVAPELRASVAGVAGSGSVLTLAVLFVEHPALLQALDEYP